MITVVFFYWQDEKTQWRRMYTYSYSHLLKAMAMVDRHLTVPHEFVVATDDVDGILKNVAPHHSNLAKIIRIEPWLYAPSKRYQKLMIYRPDAAELFGERILMMDIDNLIVDNIDALVQRYEDIVLWDNPTTQNVRTQYNTSIVLLKAGSRPCVWNEFDMRSVDTIIRAERLSGTDQAWVSRILSGEATWSKEDGIVSFTYDLLKPEVNDIPGTRIVCFNGRIHPEADVVKSKYPDLYLKYTEEY